MQPCLLLTNISHKTPPKKEVKPLPIHIQRARKYCDNSKEFVSGDGWPHQILWPQHIVPHLEHFTPLSAFIPPYLLSSSHSATKRNSFHCASPPYPTVYPTPSSHRAFLLLYLTRHLIPPDTSHRASHCTKRTSSYRTCHPAERTSSYRACHPRVIPLSALLPGMSSHRASHPAEHTSSYRACYPTGHLIPLSALHPTVHVIPPGTSSTGHLIPPGMCISSH